jgi:MFS transporter, FHS family, L-fucose permease
MLVAAISGGAAIPPMTGALATSTGNFHTAMAIPTAFYVCAWVFPVYANFFNAKMLDGHRESDLNVAPDNVKTVEDAVKMEQARIESVSEGDRGHSSGIEPKI